MATDYTPDLIAAGVKCIHAIYKEGYKFKKTGVVLLELSHKFNRQGNLLELDNENAIKKRESLMNLLDTVNNTFGKKSLSYASEGIEQPWKMNRNHKSPAYTTSWAELPQIR